MDNRNSCTAYRLPLFLLACLVCKVFDSFAAIATGPRVVFAKHVAPQLLFAHKKQRGRLES